MNSGLVTGQCTVKDFNVYLHDMKVFSNKLFDLSSFEVWDLSYKADRFTFEFWNTIPRPYINIPGSQEDSSGFF